MVTDELLPLLQERGLDTEQHRPDRLVDGRYGALRLAGLRGPDATFAVVASSPALWSDPDDASPDGFAEQRSTSPRASTTTRTSSPDPSARRHRHWGPVLPRRKDYVGGFPDDADVTSTFEPGGHTDGYWRRMLPAQLEFLGTYV